MPAAARSLRTILERAATTAAERGVEVTITLPDGTVIAARPAAPEPVRRSSRKPVTKPLPAVPDPVMCKDGRNVRYGLRLLDINTVKGEIFERDGWACRYCGATESLTVDHVRPLRRGGSEEMDNLVTACKSCNSSKGTKLLYSEWTPPCMDRVN